MSLEGGVKVKLLADVLGICVQHSWAAEQLPEPRRRVLLEDAVSRSMVGAALDLNNVWTLLLREPGVAERGLAPAFVLLEDLKGVLQIPMTPLLRLQSLTQAQRQALVSECTASRGEIERLVRQARIEAQLAGARRQPSGDGGLSAHVAAAAAAVQASARPTPVASISRSGGSSGVVEVPSVGAGRELATEAPAPSREASGDGALGRSGPGAETVAPERAPGAAPAAPAAPLGLAGPRPAGAAPGPELLTLGLTLAELCLRLGPQDAESMLRRLADLIRDHGLQLAAALPHVAPQAAPVAATGPAAPLAPFAAPQAAPVAATGPAAQPAPFAAPVPFASPQAAPVAATGPAAPPAPFAAPQPVAAAAAPLPAAAQAAPAWAAAPSAAPLPVPRERSGVVTLPVAKERSGVVTLPVPREGSGVVSGPMPQLGSGVVRAPMGQAGSGAVSTRVSMPSRPGFGMGGSGLTTDESIAREARARAARALLEQARAQSGDTTSESPRARKSTAQNRVPQRQRRGLRTAMAGVAMAASLAALAYVLLVDSASAIDLSGVRGLRLTNGRRIDDTVQAVITDPRWDRMKPDDRREAAARAFQELRPRGVRGLSLLGGDDRPEATVSDRDPNAPGVVSIHLMTPPVGPAARPAAAPAAPAAAGPPSPRSEAAPAGPPSPPAAPTSARADRGRL